MNEFALALQRIQEDLNRGTDTRESDWEIIFESLTGADDAETLTNVQDFIQEYFSFEIKDNAEGIAYYGGTGATSETVSAPVYMVVGEMVKGEQEQYGYISSTLAGKLFNEPAFKDVLMGSLNSRQEKYYEATLYNGITDELEKKVKKDLLDTLDTDRMLPLKNQGKLLVEGKEVQALNDFFSENYIKNIKTPNLNTLMSGTYPVNCWGRTEFYAVMENENIQTINGIDKNVFKDIRQCIFDRTQDEKTAMEYTTEVIRATQTSFVPKEWMQVKKGRDEKGNIIAKAVTLVPEGTEHAVSLANTLLCNNNHPSPTKLKEIVANYGNALTPANREFIETLAGETEEAVYERLRTNGKALADHAPKDNPPPLQIDPFTLTAEGNVLKNGVDVTHNREAALRRDPLSPIGYGFSTKQQILVNTLLYYDGLVFQEGCSLGESITNMKANQPDKWKKMLNETPGFLTEKDAESVIEAVLKDPKIRDLKVINHTISTSYDKGAVNACFVNDKTKEVLIAFRGTGGLEWKDTATGFYEVTSKQQQEAAEYVKEILKKQPFLKDGYAIDVTGHSAGGNKAQYVTIENPYIRECHSFDGQGFSKEFLQEKKQEIAERADKITTHAAHVDYVHCLGNNIAGKQIWYESRLPKSPFIQPLPWAWAHFPTSCIHFEENGIISMNKEVPQSEFARNINEASLKMMEAPRELQEVYFNAVVGSGQLAKTKKTLYDGKIDNEKRNEMQALKKDMSVTIAFMQENGFKDKWLLAVGKSWFGDALYLNQEISKESAKICNKTTEDVNHKPKRKNNMER